MVRIPLHLISLAQSFLSTGSVDTRAPIASKERQNCLIFAIDNPYCAWRFVFVNTLSEIDYSVIISII
jgi:hypothetical protein